MILAGMAGETFETRSQAWLHELETRKRKPVSPSTLDTYNIRINRLLKFIPAGTELAAINNKFVKDVVGRLSEFGAATTHDTLSTLRAVIASAVDPETGDQLHPRNWNFRFIDAPSIGVQKQPSMSAEQVEDAIKSARSYQTQVFFALLAGTGLRFSEARSIRVGPIENDADDLTTLLPEGIIKVRSEIYKNQELRGRTKSLAGKRFVDLHPSLASAIHKFIQAQKILPGQFLFRGEQGKPLSSSVWRKRARQAAVPGYHAFRRFRTSHLRSVPTQEDVIRYWLGHGNKTITDLYVKMGENVVLRSSWAARSGLGFSIEKMGHPAPKSKAAKLSKPRKTAVRTDARTNPEQISEPVIPLLVSNSPAPVAPQPVVYTPVYTPEPEPQIEDSDLDPLFFEQPKQSTLEELQAALAENERMRELMEVK